MDSDNTIFSIYKTYAENWKSENLAHDTNYIPYFRFDALDLKNLLEGPYDGIRFHLAKKTQTNYTSYNKNNYLMIATGVINTLGSGIGNGNGEDYKTIWGSAIPSKPHPSGGFREVSKQEVEGSINIKSIGRLNLEDARNWTAYSRLTPYRERYKAKDDNNQSTYPLFSLCFVNDVKIEPEENQNIDSVEKGLLYKFIEDHEDSIFILLCVKKEHERVITGDEGLATFILSGSEDLSLITSQEADTLEFGTICPENC